MIRQSWNQNVCSLIDHGANGMVGGILNERKDPILSTVHTSCYLLSTYLHNIFIHIVGLQRKFHFAFFSFLSRIFSVRIDLCVRGNSIELVGVCKSHILYATRRIRNHHVHHTDSNRYRCAGVTASVSQFKRGVKKKKHIRCDTCYIEHWRHFGANN